MRALVPMRGSTCYSATTFLEFLARSDNCPRRRVKKVDLRWNRAVRLKIVSNGGGICLSYF